MITRDECYHLTCDHCGDGAEENGEVVCFSCPGWAEEYAERNNWKAITRFAGREERTIYICPWCQEKPSAGSRPCWLCREREGVKDGSCAFSAGVFNPKNRSCATLDKLRELIHKHGYFFRDDQVAGSIGVLRYEGTTTDGYIVMTWYKERAGVDMAVRMSMRHMPRPLTEQEAVEAIEYWDGKVRWP